MSSKDKAYKSAKKPHAGDFKPGNKMGKSGRPIGARNKTTLAVEQLLDGEAENITRKVIEMALAGDIIAIRLCLERFAPIRKERPIHLSMTNIENMKDVLEAMGQITTSVLNGDITPSEAMSVAGVVNVYRESIITNDLEMRMRKVEEQKNV